MPGPSPTSIPAHYLKSPNHRVVPVTGAFFGANAQGKLVLTPYVDRPAVPQVIPQKIDPVSGALSDDLANAVKKEGIIRDFEVSLFMDLDVAEAIAKGLLQVIEQMRSMQQMRVTKP